MNRIILHIVIVFAAFFVATPICAQHLTYAEFLGLANLDGWSELDSELSAKGYKYAGCNEDSSGFNAYWTKNCTDTYFDNNGVFSWEFLKNDTYSIIEVCKSNKSTCYSYTISSKSIYDSFILSSKKDGFIFSSEGIKDFGIYSSYIKKSKTDNYNDVLMFMSRKKGDFMIMYTPANRITL